MIPCTMCVHEPHKSSTTLKEVQIFGFLLNHGKHPETEFILLHHKDNKAMANDFCGEVTTLKCTHSI